MLRLIIKNGSKIFSRRQSNIFSAAAVLAFAFAVSALLGILRDRLLYARFYDCCAYQLDAYNAAFRLPDIIFHLLVTGALSAAFIPVFSDQLSKSKKRAYQIASSVITILFLSFSALSVLIIIFAQPLSRLIAPGFNQTQILFMSQLTKMMVLAQLFFLLSNFLTGILQSHQRFLVPALAPVVYNLGIIFGIQFLSPIFGIFGPAMGVIIGAGLHFLVQLPLALVLGFHYSFLISFKLLEVKRILKLMLPRTLALGLGEIEATAALFLASGLPSGQLSLFYLGQRLTHFFSRLFGVTIGQASLPILSREAGKKRFDSFQKILLSSLLQAIYFAFPVGAAFLVLRIPAIRLAYGAREFPWRATLATGRLILYFAPLVVVNVFNDILVRAFYALQDTRKPLLISFFSLVINISIALIAVFKLKMGVYGLAMAITLASLVQALLLVIFLIKKTKIKNLSVRLFLPTIKIFFASLILGLATWILLRILDRYVFDTTKIAGLVSLVSLSTAIGFLIYFFLTLVLKLKQAQIVLGIFKRIFVWPKPKVPLMELPPTPE